MMKITVLRLIMERINLRLLHLFKAGTVGRISRACQKDSPDHVLHGVLDNVPVIVIVEMKVRCSSSTAARGRRRNKFVRNCSCVPWCSNDLQKHVLKNQRLFR